jgi:two-component system, LytTR family, sensor kinase
VSDTLSIGELLNVIGLSTGVVLYAMLLVMVVRAGRTHEGRSRFDPLLLATAVLGLIWNLCALPAYELPKVGIEGPFPYLTAVGFGALGFLPAVVVHSVLRGERLEARGALRRSLATVAYAISAVAVVLHIREALTGGPVPSALGMRLLTYTFVALVVPLAAVTRRQPGARRALWAAALATFAVSALHLSQLHQGDAAWPIELLGHHASLPLAVAILYQDYPFALADLFLKRALSLLAIVVLVFGAIATFGEYSSAFAQFAQFPRQVSILVTLWVATVLIFPTLRQSIVWFVDTVVLRRPDYRALSATIARKAQGQHDVPALLSDVCTSLAPALTAQSVTWCEWRSRDAAEPLRASVVQGREAAALIKATASPSSPVRTEPVTALVVTVPASEQPQYVIAIAGLMGGRRFFSDDFAALEAIAMVVARRIDTIRLAAERYDRELREREIGKLATEAELRALRAQVNPHFLFNALTTIGYLIQTAPARALQTLMRLTALLRAVLRSEGEFTTLGRELEVIEAYLDIERARFEERLAVRIDVPSTVKGVRMPPLVLQPLVENAVKHGIAHKPIGGDVLIRARIQGRSNATRELSVMIRDTGVGSTADAVKRGRAHGVGLDNVERRLTAQYGAAASLSIHTVVGLGTTVEVRLPVDASVEAETEGRRVIR